MHRDRSQTAAGTGFAKFRETPAGTPINEEEDDDLEPERHHPYDVGELLSHAQLLPRADP
jgi:hypothetical protein